MLPDFVSTKRELSARLGGAAQAIARGEPILKAIPGFRQHEGNRATLHRADGSEDTMSFDSPLSAEVSISIADTRQLGPAASIQAVREIGTKLAEGMTARLLETIQASVEEVGNVVDGKGQPFSLEMFIEALDQMELSFDERGEWQRPTFFGGERVLDAFKAQMERANDDPAIQARIDQIVDRQREEWRAREAGRTLAD